MWTANNYEHALAASNKLLQLATALNEALGAGGAATPPEAVLKAWPGINEQVQQLKLAAG